MQWDTCGVINFAATSLYLQQNNLKANNAFRNTNLDDIRLVLAWAPNTRFWPSLNKNGTDKAYPLSNRSARSEHRMHRNAKH
jgi:hypothetical protein